MSFSDYRADVPLTEKDYAKIRAEVMAKVVRRRQPWIYYALAAAVMAFALFIPRPRVNPSLSEGPVRVGAAHRPPVERAAPPPRSLAYARNDAGAKPRLRPHSKSVASFASIELETANPDVRIIWIMNRRMP